MMARSRILKPEFWSDEKLALVPREARLTFAGLWTCSDDYGVTKGHPAWLKAQIFPYDVDLTLEEFGVWLADLERIGLAHHFAFQLGSREHGAAKPEASIFHAACTRLGVAPAQVLHVGDHADMDVAGAIAAGLRGCWINRDAATWTHPQLQPDLQFDTLTGLADWLDANLDAAAPRST